MSWLVSDKVEYLHRPCRTRSKVYGGVFKDQQRNFLEIPVGATGIARQRITEASTGLIYLLCTFRVGNKRLWTRCALDTVEVL
jgi:hypothetical protein